MPAESNFRPSRDRFRPLSRSASTDLHRYGRRLRSRIARAPRAKVAAPTLAASAYLTVHSFYDAGHADGFAHGRIHGLIEGRALGREKGFEMWEELGFYEGTARAWRALGRGDEYALPPPPILAK